MENRRHGGHGGGYDHDPGCGYGYAQRRRRSKADWAGVGLHPLTVAIPHDLSLASRPYHRHLPQVGPDQMLRLGEHWVREACRVMACHLPPHPGQAPAGQAGPGGEGLDQRFREALSDFVQTMHRAGAQQQKWEDIRSGLLEGVLGAGAFQEGPIQGNPTDGNEVSLPALGSGVQSDALSLDFIMREARAPARGNMIYLTLLSDTAWNQGFQQGLSGIKEMARLFQDLRREMGPKLHSLLVALGQTGPSGLEGHLDKVIQVTDGELADPPAVARGIGSCVASRLRRQRRLALRWVRRYGVQFRDED